MIIIGYPGIGKSTIAGKNDIINLESDSFWHQNERPSDWYIYYCNVAEHLSKQGYIVFVSSHAEVQDRLKTSLESVYCIFPASRLKKEWIKRLKDRYEENHSNKNYKAWMNARDCFETNIQNLEKSGLQFYKVYDMEYRLQDIVDYLIDFDSEWHKKK